MIDERREYNEQMVKDLAMLRAELDSHRREFDAHTSRHNQLVDDLFDDIKVIKAELYRSRGFLGGVVFVITAIYSAIYIAVTYFK